MEMQCSHTVRLLKAVIGDDNYKATNPVLFVSGLFKRNDSDLVSPALFFLILSSIHDPDTANRAFKTCFPNAPAELAQDLYTKLNLANLFSETALQITISSYVNNLLKNILETASFSSSYYEGEEAKFINACCKTALLTILDDKNTLFKGLDPKTLRIAKTLLEKFNTPSNTLPSMPKSLQQAHAPLPHQVQKLLSILQETDPNAVERRHLSKSTPPPVPFLSQYRCKANTRNPQLRSITQNLLVEPAKNNIKTAVTKLYQQVISRKIKH